MVRQIIKIDSEKCNGCGACVTACHEGAIALIDGKAVLTRDDYCDGLGDCLPNCSVSAITFEMREALDYDEAAVIENKKRIKKQQEQLEAIKMMSSLSEEMTSKLNNWPVQIKLAPIKAPYFDGERLLIAADCTAFSYANFHNEFITEKITLIGCPKLDSVDYSEKLAEIIRNNNIESITVIKMEVPCCSRLLMAAKKAMEQSGKIIPFNVVTITTDGKIEE